MTAQMNGTRAWLLRHWFVPVAACMVLGDLSAWRWGGWDDARVIEAALLFDFVFVVPALYAWCYRAQGKQAVLNAVALGCFAIWASGHLIPPEEQNLLSSYGWLRYVGLAGLMLLEIKLGILVYRQVILKGQSKEAAQARLEADGMPPWVAKLMAFEAALWRKAWLWVRRLAGRR